MRAKNDLLEMADVTNEAMNTEVAQTDKQNKMSESEFQQIPTDPNIDDYLDGGNMPLAPRHAALGNGDIEQARLKSTQV